MAAAPLQWRRGCAFLREPRLVAPADTAQGRSVSAARMTGILPMLRFRHVAVILFAVPLTSSAASASPELARSKNCVACHHLERKMIGPAFKAVAERYAKDESATKTLTEKIVKGGGGNWGPTPMPPQTTVSPEDAETLAKWILSQQ